MFDIIMPKAGMAMEKGTIIRWLKDVGDTVSNGEPILEIETDKTSMQVEAMNNGVLLAKLFDAGAEVPVVTTIGYIGEKGEAPPASVDAVSATVIVEKRVPKRNAPAPESERYDIVVVGGGPAGYLAAIQAARKGAKAAVVEKSELGGTCLNRGCIPTKTFLKTAEMLRERSELRNRGVSLADSAFTVDMIKAVAHKNGVVRKLTNGVGALLKSNDVDVYRAMGMVEKDRRVALDSGELIGADKVIFAGGSKCLRIPVPGIDNPAVVTSDEILDIGHVPNRLLIIGGGVIGVEMASVFSAFGSKVTIVEMADQLLPAVDGEIAALLGKKLSGQGIFINTGTTVQKVEGNAGNSGVRVFTDKAGVIEADTVLLAVGRVPNLDGIANVDVEMERGRVVVNDFMRTSQDWIWAPGDVNGRMMLAHAAFKMAELAITDALGGGSAAPFNPHLIPACVYTKPEIASIGYTEEQAAAQKSVSVGRFPFAANGRALASGESDGFVKVVSDCRSGEILGVHCIGAGSAEMINEASVLMAMEITAHEVPEIVHAHPTFSEALMEAVADCVGVSMHSVRAFQKNS